MRPTPINQRQSINLKEVEGTTKVHNGAPTHVIGNYAYEIHNVAASLLEGELLAQYEVYILDRNAERVLVTVVEDYTGTYTYAIETFEERYNDYYGYDAVELEDAQGVITALRETYEDLLLNYEATDEKDVFRAEGKLEWLLNLKLIRMAEA